MHEFSDRLERYLVTYYGLLQSAHLVALFFSGVWWLQKGSLGFLALPPESGWTEQTIHFLAATGLFDAVIAACAIIFVLEYRRGHPRSRILGSIALTGSTYSAVIYAYGTLRSGAWGVHLWAYALIAIVFAPVVALAYVFLARQLRTAH